MSSELAQTSIDWVQILGISALVSGGVSALLNYILTMRELRKKTDMDLIQQKLDLYASMIYHLDKMKYANDALDFAHNRPRSRPERFAYSDEEWKSIIKDIDSRIQNRYFLLNRPILEKWVWAKTLTTNPVTINIMSELRTMLVEEFNQVRNKHLNHIPNVVPPILPDQEPSSIPQEQDDNKEGRSTDE